MLPGPTNVPERVTRAMFTHMINHRSSDFVELYEDAVEKTKKIFQTKGGRPMGCKSHC
jgi:aspartate aminotransferase-like enzyme